MTRPTGWAARGDSTGNLGRYEIVVPIESEGMLVVEHTAVAPAAFPLILGTADVHGLTFGVDTLAFHADLYDQVAVDDDPLPGTVALQLVDGHGNGLGGAEIRLSPEGSWEGPFYLGIAGTMFNVKSPTTVDGMGVVYFLAVDPAAGPYTPVITLEGMTCDDPVYGAAVADIAVEAATSSGVILRCN